MKYAMLSLIAGVLIALWQASTYSSAETMSNRGQSVRMSQVQAPQDVATTSLSQD